MAKYKEGDRVKVVRLVLTEADQDYGYLGELMDTLGETGTVVAIKHEPTGQHDSVYLIELAGHPDGQGYYSEYELAEPEEGKRAIPGSGWPKELASWEQAEAEAGRLLAKANESPLLEGRLRVIAAFFTWAAELEHAKRAGVWHVIGQARNLGQMLYEDRPVA